jgi:hypothetical protein
MALVEEARPLGDVAGGDPALEQPASDADALRELEAMRWQAVGRAEEPREAVATHAGGRGQLLGAQHSASHVGSPGPQAGVALHTGIVPQARYARPMPVEDSLERLSSEELHDLAVRHARRHLNVKFFWHLIEVLPAAEAAAGERDEAVADVNTLSAHLDDITNSGRGEVAELLRPFYLDYLRDHKVEASS